MLLAQAGLDVVGGAAVAFSMLCAAFSMLPLTSVLIVEGALAIIGWIRDRRSPRRSLRHIETDDDLL